MGRGRGAPLLVPIFSVVIQGSFRLRRYCTDNLIIHLRIDRVECASCHESKSVVSGWAEHIALGAWLNECIGMTWRALPDVHTPSARRSSPSATEIRSLIGWHKRQDNL